MEDETMDGAAPNPTPTRPAKAPGTGPLAGIKVLDLTFALAGPFCTLMLAGLGAEVIKVESPDGNDIARTNPPFIGPDGLKFSGQGPDDISTCLLNRNRSKKSITLDLKSPDGKKLFRDLTRHVDVVVENLSEGTADKLGVGYEAIRQENPRIIYASIMGLGQPSAYPGMKTMDIIVQALSGVMESTGDADGPPTRIGIPLGDLVAPLYAFSGILAALLHRERTGIGQRVEVNMLDTLATFLSAEQFERLDQPGATVRTGNYYDRFAPFGIYPAKDGHVAICAPRDEWACAVFDAMGRPELSRDSRFATRGQRMVNSEELNTAIRGWTERHTKAEVAHALFTERGVPSAEVRGPQEALHDENIRGRGAVLPLIDPQTGKEFATGIGIPIVFSESATGLASTIPSLGQHNAEVFGTLLDMAAPDLDDFARRKVI